MQFEAAVVDSSAAPFEEILHRLEKLHMVSIETLLAQSSDSVDQFSTWSVMTQRAHEMLRASAIYAYRGGMFGATTSGDRRLRAAALYKALGSAERRMNALEQLIHVSLAAKLVEALRRRPDLIEAELTLCHLAVTYPGILPPLALSSCDWSSLSARYAADKQKRANIWAIDGFDLIDVEGAFEQLRMSAYSAWLRLQLSHEPRVSHTEVVERYERLVDFIHAPRGSPWPLQPYVSSQPGDTLAAILSSLVSLPLRVANTADGARVAAFLESVEPFALKPLIVESAGIPRRPYIVFITSPNFFLRDYPTPADAARFAEDPNGALKRYIPAIPTSLIAQLTRGQLDSIRVERQVLRIERHVRDLGLEAVAGYTAKFIAQFLGVEEVAELLAPFVTAFLHVTIPHGDDE
jgi:hypothetical protein